MHTQDVSQSSAAVLWSAINKLQVISFLSKYHICSSKQICKRMQLLIKSCHIRICLYTWTHIFSSRTVDYQMHLWRVQDAWKNKQTNKRTEGSSATCNKSPVTKKKVEGGGGGWGKALALLLTLQWACGKSWPNFDDIPSHLLLNEFVRHFKPTIISKRSFCQYIQNRAPRSHLPLCNKLGQQNKAIKLQTWIKNYV